MCNPFSRTDHLSRRYKDLHTVARLFRKIRFDWSERDTDAAFGRANAALVGHRDAFQCADTATLART